MELEKIELIEMERIDRPKKLDRETIDPEKVRELAESIRENGLLQPVLLRENAGRYEIIAGDRRYLAHKLLGMETIKAIVKDYDDKQTVIVRGIENLQRENLSFSEEARVYLALAKDGGLSSNEISRRTGKALNTIRRYIVFAQLPDEVRRAVDDKHISMNTLDVLLEIEEADAFKYFFDMAVHNGISTRVARMWVDDHLKTKAGVYNVGDNSGSPINDDIPLKPQFMTCDVCLGAVEIRLIKNLIVCPECKKKVRAGSHV